MKRRLRLAALLPWAALANVGCWFLERADRTACRFANLTDAEEAE